MAKPASRSVGSGGITVKQAIIIAAIFEFAGAFIAGGNVTKTIRKGIIDADLMQDDPQLMVYGMMSALLAAGTWLLIASIKGWPVSTTHSIVGSIVGFGLVVGGVGIFFGVVLVKSEVVRWQRVHDMFLFKEAHMYLIIGVGVVVAMISMLIIKRFKLKDVQGKPIIYKPKPYHLGVVLGGMLLGLFNAFIAGYVSSTWADAFTFILLILILIVRPTGILGERVAEKV